MILNAQYDPQPADVPQDDCENSVRHSEELAHQLVRHLGINAARKTCAENHWTGVLAAINFIHKGA
jgi:hypothetical protein